MHYQRQDTSPFCLSALASSPCNSQPLKHCAIPPVLSWTRWFWSYTYFKHGVQYVKSQQGFQATVCSIVHFCVPYSQTTWWEIHLKIIPTDTIKTKTNTEDVCYNHRNVKVSLISLLTEAGWQWYLRQNLTVFVKSSMFIYFFIMMQWYCQ